MFVDILRCYMVFEICLRSISSKESIYDIECFKWFECVTWVWVGMVWVLYWIFLVSFECVCGHVEYSKCV